MPFVAGCLNADEMFPLSCKDADPSLMMITALSSPQRLVILMVPVRSESERMSALEVIR